MYHNYWGTMNFSGIKPMSLFDDYETILLYKSKFALSIAHHLNVV